MERYEAETISELWISLTRHCLRDGAKVFDGEEELRELLHVAFTVRDPMRTDDLDRWTEPKMVSAMHANFHSTEPQFGYKVSYGERIWTPAGTSAYESVRAILGRKPEAKSATMTLLLPQDHTLGHVPCITSIDFKIRDGLLHVSYFARSQDLFKKNYADNLAIHGLARKLAPELGVEPGPISAYIVSGHVYLSDAERIRAVAPLSEGVEQMIGANA